ncbi:MAG: helix-turn-helix domain-containing protein [Dermatophilaceae bacterium]
MYRAPLPSSSLGEVRFAVSALSEMVHHCCLRAGETPAASYPLASWFTRLSPHLPALLGALVSSPGYSPDFLEGLPPESAEPADIDHALSRLRETPGAIVHRDLAVAWPDGPPGPIRELTEGGEVATLLDHVVTELKSYWAEHLAAAWPILRRVLLADVSHRADLVARHGLRRALTGLHPTVSVQDGGDGPLLAVRDCRSSYPDHSLVHGVVCVPSAFVPARVSLRRRTPEHPLVLYYPARGLGAVLAQRHPVPAGDILSALVGPTRAAILRALVVEHSAEQLGDRLGISPGAVRQQLVRLRAGGVVDTRRSGRFHRYGLTGAGRRLVDDLATPSRN